MKLWNAAGLNEGVRGREVLAWSLFDAANSGYSTVVQTAVFNAFFVAVVCGGAEWGTLVWSCAVALGNAVSMLVMPAVGRVADLTAGKKKWLFAATMLCIVCTALLALSGPQSYVLSVSMIVLSLIGYNVGESLNSAFLPELARPEALGKVSGWGWSLGYVGGLVTLALCLGATLAGQRIGWSNEMQVAASCVITAAVFLLVSMPLFLWLRERAEPQGEAIGLARAFVEGMQELKGTYALLKHYTDFKRLVVCGFLYQCGIATVIALAAIYASAVMGFGMTETLVLVLLVNITAAVGAFAFGYIQDKIGHKASLAATLVVWIAMVATAAAAQTPTLFWVSANLAGLAMGSSQSAGRAMVGLLAPASRLAQFYGFWNMALWLSAIVGPITYGLVTWISGNDHRLAIQMTGLFFAAGLATLSFVNLARGTALARGEATDSSTS